MAVASKYSVSKPRRQVASKSRTVAELNLSDKPLAMSAKGLPNRIKPSGKTVPILPTAQSSPFWLLRLCTWQRRPRLQRLF
jgi:hypothetical protein